MILVQIYAQRDMYGIMDIQYDYISSDLAICMILPSKLN
jgi:hypothetical protein